MSRSTTAGRRALAGFCAASILCTLRVAHAVTIADVQPCEPLSPTQHYDNYNDPAAKIHLGTVEQNHFSADVEHLRKGLTAPLPRDIAFVLRQFPNHYRALNAMAVWQLEPNHTVDAENNVWTADCYFLRAIAFIPDDWKVHYIYAIYLHRAGRLGEAGSQYDLAEAEGASGADYFYNRGLFEVDAGHLAKAEDYARKAYAEGAVTPGLRDKIARARSAAAAGSDPRGESSTR